MKIQNLKPKNKRYTVAFGDSLFLRVSPSGHKSWVLRYCHAGSVRDITLGTWPELSSLQAKQVAHLKREELKIKPSKGVTFIDAVTLWKQKKKGHIVSFESELRRIEIYLIPKLKKLQLEEITAPLVLNLLLNLKDKLPTLKRILMRLNEILDLAVCAGLLLSNPCRKLSKVFATHTPVNRPFIPAAKLGDLFTLLKGHKLWFHCFVLWAVYSMLRPIECVSVRWSWIEDNILTLPAEIMKKRRTHRVPLCPEILKILALVKSIRPRRSTFIWSFTCTQHLNKQHLSRFLNHSTLKGQLCHHGLRATARTWMRDQNVPWEVAEDCLAHLSGSTTERAYLRGDYLEQKRDVYQKYWNYIFKIYCASCAGDSEADKLIATVEGTENSK